MKPLLMKQDICRIYTVSRPYGTPVRYGIIPTSSSRQGAPWSAGGQGARAGVDSSAANRKQTMIPVHRRLAKLNELEERRKKGWRTPEGFVRSYDSTFYGCFITVNLTFRQ